MVRDQISPVLMVIWIAMDGTFDVWLRRIVPRPEYYWMFVAVILIMSFGACMELQHRLRLRGWTDPTTKLWRRKDLVGNLTPAAVANAAIQPLGATEGQIRRYNQFVAQVKSDYRNFIDFEAHIDFEFSHFRHDGSVVINVHAKTKADEGLLQVLKSQLEQDAQDRLRFSV